VFEAVFELNLFDEYFCKESVNDRNNLILLNKIFIDNSNFLSFSPLKDNPVSNLDIYFTIYHSMIILKQF